MAEKVSSDNRSKYAGTPHVVMKKKDGTISKSLRALDERWQPALMCIDTVAGYFGRQVAGIPFAEPQLLPETTLSNGVSSKHSLRK